MNILFPIPCFYPHSGGGPSLTVYWLSKALVEKGNNVNVVTTDKGINARFPSNRWNIVDGIRVKYCSYSIFKFPIRMIFSSIKEIKRNDIVQLSSACSLASLFVALIAIYFNKKIIWSPRGEFSSAVIGDNWLKTIYFKMLGLLFARNVLFHSTSEKETLEIRRIMGNCNVVTLPNYMEIPPKHDGNVEKMLLYVGRINPIKAIDKLIEALHNSSVFKNSDYVLKIAGNTSSPEVLDYYNLLKKQIKDYDFQNRVLFLGPVYGDEKYELYSKAYFSFLVSESENFGNVVIESLSQGTPAVSSLGTPWQILPDKQIGYHVSNDPTELSKVIDEILQMPIEEYSEMRKRAYKICNEVFSIEKNVDKWLDLYVNY